MFIIGNLAGCVLWGSVAAMAVTAGVWLLCRSLDCYPSLPMYGILAVLLLLTGFQTTMLTGALYFKGYVADANEYAAALVTNAEDDTYSVSDINQYREKLTEHYPMLKPFISNIDMSGSTEYISSGKDLLSFLVEKLNGTINSYILRRVLWLTGFILAAIFSIVFTSRYTASSHSLPGDAYQGQAELQF